VMHLGTLDTVSQ